MEGLVGRGGHCVADSSATAKASDSCSSDGFKTTTDNNCSILYFTHPSGVPLSGNNVGLPYFYDLNEFTNGISWVEFRQELTCSPSDSHSDWYYWEKCCFIN